MMAAGGDEGSSGLRARASAPAGSSYSCSSSTTRAGWSGSCVVKSCAASGRSRAARRAPASAPPLAHTKRTKSALSPRPASAPSITSYIAAPVGAGSTASASRSASAARAAAGVSKHAPHTSPPCDADHGVRFTKRGSGCPSPLRSASSCSVYSSSPSMARHSAA
jgi:hypothetical protein